MFPLLLLLLLFISEQNDAYRLLLLLLFAVFHFRTVLCVSAWICLCVRVRGGGCVRMRVSVSVCGSISKHAVYLMHKQ